MRTAHRILAGAGVAAGSLLIYATLIEPRHVQVTRPLIHVRDLPRALEGLRIGLLSDLHAGRLTSHATLERAVALLMAERPDLIAITGDFVDQRHADYAAAFRALEPLSAPLGVYAVPGNHDHAVGIEAWRGEIRASRMLDATNGFYVQDVDGTRVCIAGADDLDEGDPELRLPDAAERDFTLLLAHNPETAERARRSCDAVDLMLAGHTHGGQVRLPGWGPIERKSQIYDAGLRRRPWTQVYTSRGIGSTLLPMRFGARPEVALIRLTAASRAAW